MGLNLTGWFVHKLAVLAVVAGLALVAAPRTGTAEPANFTIDPEHFVVAFLVEHIGYGKVLGMFREASGSFTYDETTRAISNLKISVKTASVFTNHKERDEHLRGPDFLNSREFPEMNFVGRSAEPTGEKTGKVTGDLTLIGRTRSLALDLTLNKAAVYPFASGVFSRPNYVVGISARGGFKRGEFDMTYALDNGWVGDDVQLIVEFEAIRK
jgi:polyisoprenoid-binding protein YceI